MKAEIINENQFLDRMIFWTSLRLIRLSGGHISIQNDRVWFEFLLNPEQGSKYCEFQIPSLPPNDVQVRFTGRKSRANLTQAYHFYKFIYQVCNLDYESQIKILDFGGGWGRISRFFLRNTDCKNIWVSDVLSDSIHWLAETESPCNVIKNEPLPPIPKLEVKFNLIYAFSVFSHLSEPYFRQWIDYLLTCLVTNGYLVFTTRGAEFIDYIERLEKKGSRSGIPDSLLSASAIRQKYSRGEFQFFPMSGGGELSQEYYGEAFVPPEYVKEHYSENLVVYSDSVPTVDQVVFVLRKKA